MASDSRDGYRLRLNPSYELAAAFVVSTITAFVAVKWLLRYIQSHRFTAFAVYRIVLGAALLLWLPATA
jgi:undecaprenyl-diphosphatase